MAALNDDLFVTKRGGKSEPVAFDKILNRIKKIGKERGLKLNYASLAMKVIDQLYNGISTTKIDELSAEQCAFMATTHPDYAVLASAIIVSNHHKSTKSSFSKVIKEMAGHKDIHGKVFSLVSTDLAHFVKENADALDALCDYSRDFLIDYFGFKTLEKSYLIRVGGKVVERPQHMWLRVSIGIHLDGPSTSMERIKETYDLMSQKYFTHATPTLFNAGTPKPQLSSCFLLAMESDSIDGIFNTLKECAVISKYAGGIGLHIHNVRATGSHIRGTNGTSNGIIPMLRVFNNTAKYVDQCVVPETIIYTTQGPKQIQHCVMNETEIYNLKGETEVIQNVLEHPYEGEILEIETMHSIHPLTITPEHPVYVLRGQTQDLSHKEIKNCIDKNNCEFEWVDAKDINFDDMVVYPIPSYSKDIASLSADDCYVYGVILGDGSMSNKTDTSGYISVHKKHIADFIIHYFNDRCVDYKIEVDNNTTRIRWNRCIHLPFRYNDFYDENKEKRMLSKWLNLPIEKSKYILKGLLDTDEYTYTKDEFVLDSTSYILIECARFLAMKMGVLPRGSIRSWIDDTYPDKPEIEKSYVLRIPKTTEICDLMNIQYDDTQVFKFIRHNNLLLSRVKRIKTHSYNGILYDLQMEKEHNYVIHNGVVHNGGGKRNGSIAIYLEPWHADIEDFLDMRKNHGDEERKARDLFCALWISDLFMTRVKNGGKWTLFCPDECPGLADVYGDEFEALYKKYEDAGKGKKTIEARKLWYDILDSQMETGTPYMVYKDASNKKSNQKNVGVIKSSNLCSEIIEYSDANETAVCNLASVALPSFVKCAESNGDDDIPTVFFDHEKLVEVVRVITYNLNRIIDINFYPTEKTRRSNMRHRPIGIGVQGLADVFMMLDLPFDSPRARELNKEIFETIYYAALSESAHLATIHGAYETFAGSPASKGVLQFDMWETTPTSRYDWDELKQRIINGGLRNSLLLAPMPTASTSQILGFNECIEPITSNIYSRRTNAGEFIIANKYLMNDLLSIGKWTEAVKQNIIANNGSIQQLTDVPQPIRDKYKTVWELSMRTLIDMAADRGAFICQSQSLNLWMESPTREKLTAMHMYAWSKGLKTGLYYLRRRARHQAQQFTIEPEKRAQHKEEDEGGCELCSA